MMTQNHLVTQVEGLTESYFQAPFWQQHKAVTGTSGGRNTVWFVAPEKVLSQATEVNVQAQEWVLRHYYRGGLPGKFIRRSFVYTGLSRTRSMAEYQMLLDMGKAQLPVPKPVAALVKRRGITYQASLLIERIPHTQDVGRLLLQQSLNEEEWMTVGATVRRFHLAGVYHSDLNCKNILWRALDQQAFLIDFDRCGMKPRPYTSSQILSWQMSNLQRLLRSFEKELANTPSGSRFHWQPADWQAFMAGYSKAP
ncbi:3-deoxy-D-manno-octulosonic acid kinase [Aliidiomarina taiwanensis]|uniref:3-deoxy-D-manno-octulosonic acid kinase n=1 Tax=Aliidiomarina taiwanensis TaxID=946228 RepID=A0A432X9H9_9GAMM|nr:3-deoxy-D-manno-octulosonic acid kinase [Aliidiomarina taiwanensis]RUO44072.1 3-deoxy-D-manno-octulosonic acid kinase [Aliidiomarina taiwanensis]